MPIFLFAETWDFGYNLASFIDYKQKVIVMFKRIQRPDGSVIILAPKKDTKAVTFQVLYKVGSRNEGPSINGASHFVEHLMFKGTKKRPNTKIISRELDGIGAMYNAFTGKDHTGYYIKADATHLELAIDVLSDMLRHSIFDPKEVEKERGVIIEEINMYEDNPMMHIEDMFEELVYKGTPLARPIAGPREVIKKVSRDSLHNYKQKFYYPGNMVLGLAGAFDEVKAERLLKRYLPIEKKLTNKFLNPRAKFKQNSPRVKIAVKNVEQVQAILGFPGLHLRHKDLPALMVLANILGGNMSSRLFINVRERQGLCYSIRASADSNEDLGTFYVASGLDKKRLIPALELIKSELNRIKKIPVTSEELKRAKENIRGTSILRLESASTYLAYLQTQELLLNKIETLEEKLAKIQQVTRADVLRVAKHLIRWRQSNLAIIGPYKNNRQFIKLLQA